MHCSLEQVNEEETETETDTDTETDIHTGQREIVRQVQNSREGGRGSPEEAGNRANNVSPVLSQYTGTSYFKCKFTGNL